MSRYGQPVFRNDWVALASRNGVCNMTDRAFLAFALVAGAQIVFGSGALTGLFWGRKVPSTFMSCFLALGASLVLAASFLSYPQSYSYCLQAPLFFGLAPVAFRIDSLSSFFLFVFSLLALAVSLFSAAYIDHFRARISLAQYWSCFYLFVMAICCLLISANAVCFLVFWEIMSLACLALVACEHAKKKSQKSAMIYLGATRISTSFLTLGFVFMYLNSRAHAGALTGWDFSSWNLSGANALLPASLILLGLCIKAGLWPFHIWLPYAHPEAPAPVSALMSGIMVKVAIYAMLRIFVFSSCNQVLLAYLLMTLGVVSSVWGLLFALMQNDLKTLLAYSTVENMGLLSCALALSMLAKQSGLNALGEMAMAALCLHLLNHAVFKSLLFLSAGSVDANARTRNLSLLGGLAKGMPLTFFCFFLGSLAVCALPPLNGFVSKWLLYQSLFQCALHLSSPEMRFLTLLVIGVLSFVGALSLAVFSKAVGIAFLGRPRSSQAASASEKGWGMIAAQIYLAALCLISGLAAPVVLKFLNPLVSEALGREASLSAALSLPLTLPVLVLSALLLALLVYAFVLSARAKKLSKYISWDCGYGDLPSRAEETASSFSQPIGRIFAGLLQYTVNLQIQGKDRRHFPESIKVETLMLSLLETRVYRPSIELFRLLSAFLMRMQTGSIHIHLLYVFLTMLLLLCLGAWMGGK